MKISPLLFLIVLVSAASASSALAQTSTWSIGTGSWNTPGNWNPSGVPVASDNLEFDGVGSSATITDNNTVGSNIAYGTILFTGAGSYTINPSGTDGSQFRTQNITDNSTSTETINPKIDNATTRFITVISGGNLVLGGVYSGAGGISANGAGTLTLSAANTFTGPLAVTGGGSVLAGQGGNITNGSTATASVAAGSTFGTVVGNTGADTLLVNTVALTLNMGTTPGGGSNLQLNLFSGSSDTITAGAFNLVSGAGTVLVTLNDATGTDNLSGQYTLMTWTSNTGVTPVTGDFTLAGSAATDGSLLVSGDNLYFEAAAIPEPSTWALMLTGLAVMAGVNRRFRFGFSRLS